MKKKTGKEIKKNRPVYVRRHLFAILLCVMLLTLSVTSAAADVHAQESSGANGIDVRKEAVLSDGEKQLTITVVEDIPAEEIEESEVPLAALPNAGARSGTRHAVWMGALLAEVLVYVFYFSAYDRRLFSLRQEAARKEQTLMALRRMGSAEENHER